MVKQILVKLLYIRLHETTSAFSSNLILVDPCVQREGWVKGFLVGCQQGCRKRLETCRHARYLSLCLYTKPFSRPSLGIKNTDDMKRMYFERKTGTS